MSGREICMSRGFMGYRTSEFTLEGMQAKALP